MPFFFGSWHPGATLFAMCDGSVRQFRLNADRNVLYFCANRGDGAAVEPEQPLRWVAGRPWIKNLRPGGVFCLGPLFFRIPSQANRRSPQSIHPLQSNHRHLFPRSLKKFLSMAGDANYNKTDRRCFAVRSLSFRLQVFGSLAHSFGITDHAFALWNFF